MRQRIVLTVNVLPMLAGAAGLSDCSDGYETLRGSVDTTKRLGGM